LSENLTPTDKREMVPTEQDGDEGREVDEGEEVVEIEQAEV
jgi:hypothetical protein